MGKGHRRERGAVLHCPRVVNAAWSKIQRSAEVGAPGLVNFITAVANNFCSILPAAFTQPGASTLADLF